ncbi:pentatricopeptide repeat-containing protein At5g65570 [Syzygium oleosum]|uniref:pentatricopeptide repeat-containing protein At5g65570 n=1 Tax=Syzygium oleosum TaxID=219896 RepID=UPI0011D22326|nr:pentatricopeptide repeat-containing protein At5g65570 [Syzygium oleosum]
MASWVGKRMTRNLHLCRPITSPFVFSLISRSDATTLTSSNHQTHPKPSLHWVVAHTINCCSTFCSPSQGRTPQSYSSLLGRCAETRCLLDVRKVQTQLVKTALCPTLLGHKLIDAYLKCGSVGDARGLFDEMPERHVITWNSMIASYIKQRRSEEAIELYERMMSEGVFPDEYTFSSVFKAFSDLGLAAGGRRAHGLAVVLGLEVSNVFVGSALVDMYAKFGKMSDAQLVADRVTEQDVVLLTALIVGYVQHGEDFKAREVFSDMIRKGVKPNEFTLASTLIGCANSADLKSGKLIHACIVKTGFDHAIASQTSLLTMYSKCGIIDDSFKVFNDLANPNLVTWTSLIVGLVQNGREEIALLKFREMLQNSVNPNSFTLSSVLRACSSLAMLETGKQIHAVLTKHGLVRNAYAGVALIDLYGKCGMAEMARSVFDRLIDIDMVSMNSMIYSYAVNGLGREALGLYNRMKDLKLEQNQVTFVAVLLACSNAGLVEEGRQIFSYLRDSCETELTRDHYACMVDLLGRSGRLEEAEMLVTQINNPDLVVWRTLLSACRVHGDVKIAERAMKKVLELVPGDEGTHVLLSNLYASTCNWSQLIEMKSTMREMKLKKNPAMSWVEVDREVHTFMAGDLSHLGSKEILDTLEELIEKVRNLGYVPDTRYVLQDLDEEKKETSLYFHSEKLALAFALSRAKNKINSVRILKNLRVCGDCHTWMKYVSVAVGREIIARDSKRYHHMKDGQCSCRDYW